MKVLVSAYSCEPGRGSEPGVGWNCVRQAARFHDVWVLTQEEGHQGIKAALAGEALPGVRFVYLDLPPWALFWKKGLWGAQVHYCLWQLAAYFAGRRLHRKVGFDLVHHVTYGAFWYPTLLPFLPIPFIWGPIGAGYPCPRIFHREFSFRGRANEWARQALLAVSRLDPIRRQTEKRASVILAVSPVTVEQLRPKNREKALLFSQVGVGWKEIARFPEKRSNDGRPFRLLSVGRLLHWKGFALGIKAFALFNQQYPNSEYCIIGDGPERTKLSQLVCSMGLSDAVQLLGTLSREDYLHELVNSDVLVHPSLHEPGAYVIAEAMAARLPVICSDFGEPASIVSPETGIRVPLASPECVVAGISRACALLAANPSVCNRMGDAARQRILDLFEWDKKGLFMTKLYQSLSTPTKGRGDVLADLEILKPR
jgi:glycosyltransferase involved in cell wall biosynthesis